jgi:hypothetical protein
MATTFLDGSTLTLGKLVTELAWQVNGQKVSPREAISLVVDSVPANVLGEMIREADQFIEPFTVKSRIGFTSRYPESWEKYLRETLESILEGIIALDYAK